MIYHSALEKYNQEIELSDPISSFNYKGSTCFTHDICEGVPQEFKKCDCIYFEPFWESGFKKFKDKSGICFDYNDTLDKINKFIESVDIPVYTIMSKPATKRMVKPDCIQRVLLHDYESNLLVWNDEIETSNETNFDIIKRLSYKYNLVGDFMCGYGNTGMIFTANGKKFIMSDLLTKCVTTVYKRMRYEQN